MKKLIALAIAATLPCIAFSAERPDGRLGTTMLTVGGIYANVDASHYSSELDFNFSGIEMGINQPVMERRGFAVDFNTTISHITNNNLGHYVDLDATTFLAGLTFYRDGMLSPYFRPVLGYSKISLDLQNMDELDGWDEDDELSGSDSTWIYGAQAGVEIHLIRGLSVTPYISYMGFSEDILGTNTEVGVNIDYWFSDRFGVFAGFMYTTEEHIDATVYELGASMHY
ncbi:MAG: hypothetical protein JW942_03825 [Opitutales bacterium]|nr:hypothetical protein [Opitutales bacterium]